MTLNNESILSSSLENCYELRWSRQVVDANSRRPRSTSIHSLNNLTQLTDIEGISRCASHITSNVSDANLV